MARRADGQGPLSPNGRTCASATAADASMRDEERNACPQRGNNHAPPKVEAARDRNSYRRPDRRDDDQTRRPRALSYRRLAIATDEARGAVRPSMGRCGWYYPPVERSVEEKRAGMGFTSPKTKRGRRNIALPPDAIAILRAHKVKTLELRLALAMGNIAATWILVRSRASCYHLTTSAETGGASVRPGSCPG